MRKKKVLVITIIVIILAIFLANNIISSELKEKKIVSINCYNETQDVFNIKVQDYMDYFASGFLVHNTKMPLDKKITALNQLVDGEIAKRKDPNFDWDDAYPKIIAGRIKGKQLPPLVNELHRRGFTLQIDPLSGDFVFSNNKYKIQVRVNVVVKKSDNPINQIADAEARAALFRKNLLEKFEKLNNVGKYMPFAANVPVAPSVNDITQTPWELTRRLNKDGIATDPNGKQLDGNYFFVVLAKDVRIGDVTYRAGSMYIYPYNPDSPYVPGMPDENVFYGFINKLKEAAILSSVPGESPKIFYGLGLVQFYNGVYSGLFTTEEMPGTGTTQDLIRLELALETAGVPGPDVDFDYELSGVAETPAVQTNQNPAEMYADAVKIYFDGDIKPINPRELQEYDVYLSSDQFWSLTPGDYHVKIAGGKVTLYDGENVAEGEGKILVAFTNKGDIIVAGTIESFIEALHELEEGTLIHAYGIAKFKDGVILSQEGGGNGVQTTGIDDLDPEAFAYNLEQLFEAILDDWKSVYDQGNEPPPGIAEGGLAVGMPIEFSDTLNVLGGNFGRVIQSYTGINQGIEKYDGGRPIYKVRVGEDADVYVRGRVTVPKPAQDGCEPVITGDCADEYDFQRKEAEKTYSAQRTQAENNLNFILAVLSNKIDLITRQASDFTKKRELIMAYFYKSLNWDVGTRLSLEKSSYTAREVTAIESAFADLYEKAKKNVFSWYGYKISTSCFGMPEIWVETINNAGDFIAENIRRGGRERTDLSHPENGFSIIETKDGTLVKLKYFPYDKSNPEKYPNLPPWTGFMKKPRQVVHEIRTGFQTITEDMDVGQGVSLSGEPFIYAKFHGRWLVETGRVINGRVFVSDGTESFRKKAKEGVDEIVFMEGDEKWKFVLRKGKVVKEKIEEQTKSEVKKTEVSLMTRQGYKMDFIIDQSLDPWGIEVRDPNRVIGIRPLYQEFIDGELITIDRENVLVYRKGQNGERDKVFSWGYQYDDDLGRRIAVKGNGKELRILAFNGVDEIKWGPELELGPVKFEDRKGNFGAPRRRLVFDETSAQNGLREETEADRQKAIAESQACLPKLTAEETATPETSVPKVQTPELPAPVKVVVITPFKRVIIEKINELYAGSQKPVELRAGRIEKMSELELLKNYLKARIRLMNKERAIPSDIEMEELRKLDGYPIKEGTIAIESEETAQTQQEQTGIMSKDEEKTILDFIGTNKGRYNAAEQAKIIAQIQRQLQRLNSGDIQQINSVAHIIQEKEGYYLSDASALGAGDKWSYTYKLENGRYVFSGLAEHYGSRNQYRYYDMR